MSSQAGERVQPRMMQRCKRDSTSTLGNQSRTRLAQKKLDDPLDQRRQCQWLGVNRAGWSYQPVDESVENLHLMQLLDEQYTRCPFDGVLRMTAWLWQQGHAVNAKRVRRLLRQMGLMAVYPKPHLSQPGSGGQLYPY
jgi:putative transposase